MEREREREDVPSSKTKASRKSRGTIVGVSNPRQEKRGQKGLEVAYNSGLMVGWTKGVDGEEQGLDGRITRSLPVAPARASVSARAAPSPLALSSLPSPSLHRTCPPPPPFLYNPFFIPLPPPIPSSSSPHPSTRSILSFLDESCFFFPSSASKV